MEFWLGLFFFSLQEKKSCQCKMEPWIIFFPNSLVLVHGWLIFMDPVLFVFLFLICVFLLPTKGFLRGSCKRDSEMDSKRFRYWKTSGKRKVRTRLPGKGEEGLFAIDSCYSVFSFSFLGVYIFIIRRSWNQ